MRHLAFASFLLLVLLYSTNSFATDCNTDCNQSCSVTHNWPCPKWNDPGRMCQKNYVEPACRTRCIAEKEAIKRTGMCDPLCAIHRVHAFYPQAVVAIRGLHSVGAIRSVHECHSAVNSGGLAHLIGEKAGVIGAPSGLYNIGVAAVGKEITKQIFHCACKYNL